MFCLLMLPKACSIYGWFYLYFLVLEFGGGLKPEGREQHAAGLRAWLDVCWRQCLFLHAPV